MKMNWRLESASRILEGLVAMHGLVEPREGIGRPLDRASSEKRP